METRDLSLRLADLLGREHAALAGQVVGVREVELGRWVVTFMDYDLGYYDTRTRRFEPNGLPVVKKEGSRTISA